MKPENEQAMLEVVKAARRVLSDMDRFGCLGPGVNREELRAALQNLDRLDP